MQTKIFNVRSMYDHEELDTFVSHLGDRLVEVRQYGRSTFAVIYTTK